MTLEERAEFLLERHCPMMLGLPGEIGFDLIQEYQGLAPTGYEPSPLWGERGSGVTPRSYQGLAPPGYEPAPLRGEE